MKKQTHLTITQDFVKELQVQQLDFWVTFGIIKKFYCNPMFVNGLCPLDCTRCKTKLARETNLADARNPAAMFTYNMKHLTAVSKETPKSIYIPKESLFKQKEVNPFEELAR
jgi:hypothetical protein